MPVIIKGKRGRGRPFKDKPPKTPRRMGRPPAPNKEPEGTPIDVTNVFVRNRQAKKEIIIDRGGSRSSKSYSVIQEMTERFFSHPGRQILMLRKTLPACKKSLYKETVNYMTRIKMHHMAKENKQDLTFTYNGAVMSFSSLDDHTKIRSTEWNDIVFEEANDFTWDDFVTARTRLSAPLTQGYMNQLWLMLNPDDEFHWIKTNIIDEPSMKNDHIEIPSSYLDNPFLPEQYVKSLLQLQYQDPNYYRIYTLGEWGKLLNAIYSNWVIINTFPTSFDEIVYGLDFGFNAPTALVKVGFKDEEVFEEELLYETGLTNSQLITKLEELIPPHDRRNKFIFADAGEPDRIREIEHAGFLIYPADKSVEDGIDMVKRFKCHVASDSINLQKEKRKYAWKTDRKNLKKILDEPVKHDDHLMDAERYAIYTYAKEYLGGFPGIRDLGSDN